VQVFLLLSLRLEGNEWWASSLNHYHSPPTPSAHRICSWVDPREGLDLLEVRRAFYPAGNWTPDHPAFLPSHYWLSHPGNLPWQIFDWNQFCLALCLITHKKFLFYAATNNILICWKFEVEFRILYSTVELTSTEAIFLRIFLLVAFTIPIVVLPCLCGSYFIFRVKYLFWTAWQWKWRRCGRPENELLA
jgi:hypothetical protein